MARRQGRTLALQALFQMDIGHQGLEQALSYVCADQPPDTAAYAATLVRGYVAHASEVDQLLARLATDWSLERMASVDRNVLRLSTYELMCDPETPTEAILNEAIELAKTYSTEASGKFVHGILAQASSQVRGG